MIFHFCKTTIYMDLDPDQLQSFNNIYKFSIIVDFPPGAFVFSNVSHTVNFICVTGRRGISG